MGLKKSVANRLGNGKKLDIRRLTCDEITKHIKITNDRNSQSVNQVLKARKICVLPRDVLEI